ncbi:hypothetical protein DFH28DRAFT_985968, partial [Melampsora americana]
MPSSMSHGPFVFAFLVSLVIAAPSDYLTHQRNLKIARRQSIDGSSLATLTNPNLGQFSNNFNRQQNLNGNSNLNNFNNQESNGQFNNNNNNFNNNNNNNQINRNVNNANQNFNQLNGQNNNQ